MRDLPGQPLNDFQFITKRISFHPETDIQLNAFIDKLNERGYEILDYQTHTETIHMQSHLIVVFRVRKRKAEIYD
ncbi:hypothetical protein J2R98_002323 [Alkalibacillus filiformis]|uniref:DUF4177 domain-containing protein n=1 Tax=Alkalibacillus filiformis TaxID=200990 RepID=A0ABU0DVW3_9BACI|nr:hypothetical protein [Alkalibacillus filiformis]MDQ0352479.1 hypothetical protein [Alkalibacillus filiformis]